MAFILREEFEVSVRTDHQVDGTDASVSTGIWDNLGLPPSASLRIALSLRSSSPSNPSEDFFDCWARKSRDSDGITLPSSWNESNVISAMGEFDNRTWKVSISRPRTFTTIFVNALCREDYEAACTHHERFEAWLSQHQRIIRRGMTLNMPGEVLGSSVARCRYKIVMTEPHSMGLVDIATTRIILTPSNTPQNQQTDEEHASPTISLVEELEIGEDFLASSVLSPAIPENTSASHTHPSSLKDGIASPLQLRLHYLPAPVSLTDDHTLYLRTNDLSKLGVLSGDWAAARIRGSDHERMVRVCVYTQHNVPMTGSCLVSPVLAYNLASGSLDRISASEAPNVLLRTLVNVPFIGTAKSVTLARVASPVTTLKLYEQPLLQAMRFQLVKAPRTVAEGDIICTGLSAGSILRPDEGDTETAGVNSAPHDLVAFYKVTELALPTRFPELSASIRPLAWIDPITTALVQAGLVSDFVPDVTSYMNIGLPLMALNTSTSPNAREDLYSLISAMARPHLSGLHIRLPILIKGAPGVGKFTAVIDVARRLGLHVQEANCHHIVGDSDVVTEAALRVQFDRAAACSPCILVLRHLDALGQSTQPDGLAQGLMLASLAVLQACVHESVKKPENIVMVVGTTTDPDRLSASALSMFKHDLTLTAPTESERLQMLISKTLDMPASVDVSLSAIATRSAALVSTDLVDLIHRSEVASAKRSLRQCPSALVYGYEVLTIKMVDYDDALSRARKAYSESIGAPKIPNVTWDDVGGLAKVKGEVLDTIQLPLDHPELFGGGLKKRSGVLLYGPPGTGKTLVAKAVATSCSLNFLSVKGPELLNMYIGESEANVRRIFQRARDAKPCVIFFDELDSVAPKRGNQGDSGGVMDRIVSQILAELDGVAGGGSTDIFVIGATNRPDLLDPALLRPGRFDRMLYLGLSDTHEAQLQLLQALTRKFRLHPELNLAKVAAECALNLTGADFYALCADAMLKAMIQKVQDVDDVIQEWNEQGHIHEDHPHPITAQYYLSEIATAQDIQVRVAEEHFITAMKDLIPSVSAAELEHYNRIQSQYSK